MLSQRRFVGWGSLAVAAWGCWAFAAASAAGQTHRWNAAVSGNYATPGLWDVNDVPNLPADNVLIDATGANYTITYNSLPAANINIGQLTLNSANATFTMSGASAFTVGTLNVQQGAFNVGSGTLNLGGAMNITGGSASIGSGTINGGTILAGAGLRLQNTILSATLNNVTLGDAANADVLRLDTGRTWNFQGTTDFRAGFAPKLTAATRINYLNSLTTATDLTLTRGTVASQTAGQTVTIGVGRTLNASPIAIGSNAVTGAGNWINNGTIRTIGDGAALGISGSGSFVNNGTMLAQSSGASVGTLTIANAVSSFANNGILRATSNGVLRLQKNVTTAQLGNWDTTGGGQVRLNNTLDNVGSTLDATAARGTLFLEIATVNGGTIAADAGVRVALFASSTDGTLNNVTLGGANGNKDVLRLDSGGNWNFQGTTDFQAGFVPTMSGNTHLNYLTSRTIATDLNLAGASVFSATAGQTLTVGAGRTISAAAGTSGQLSGPGNWINNGILQTVGNGAFFTVDATGSFVNNGTLLAQSSGAFSFFNVQSSVSSFVNNGTLRATADSGLFIRKDMTTAQLGNWDSTGGGQIVLSGMTLDNSGDALNLSATRGQLIVENNTTVNGGTVSADPGLRLAAQSNGFSGFPTLSNVTLGGSNGNKDVLRLDQGTWNFHGTTDFQAGFVPTLTNGTRINFLTALTPATDIALVQGALSSATAGQTVTIGAGRTVSASSFGNLDGDGNWINNGTIQASPGASLAIQNTGTFTNAGTILAQSGQVTLDPGTLTNYDAGTFTLTGGMYRVLGGTIDAGTREFRHIAGGASVTLGGGSVFEAIEGKLASVGANSSIIIEGGRSLAIANPSNSFTNSGLVKIDGVGSEISIDDGINLTNFSSGTLAGGTFEVRNGGQINLGTRVTPTIAANTRIVLDGATSAFSSIEGGVLTTVNGTLNINNGKTLFHSAAGLTVGAGGVLSGNGGTLDGGLLTIAAGGLISPGNSTGTITGRGGIRIDGDYLAEIDDDGIGPLVAGLDYDQITVATGLFIVGPNSHLLVSFGPHANFADPYWNSVHEWKIVDAPTGLANIQSYWSASQIVLLNGPFSAGQFDFRLSENPGLFLTFTPVPEPGTFALALLAAAASRLARRKRG